MFFRVFILVIIFFCGTVFYTFTNEWFDFSSIESSVVAKPSIILDSNGDEIGRFELDKRAHIPYEKLSPVLVKAFIAAEDHSFFTHSGVSVKGIIRSFLVNIYRGRIVQGASTITQQLIRLLFLSGEKKYLRKIKEGFLAFAIENYLTKEQILEHYLNNIYFGRGIYGVEAACRRFWSKSASSIDACEAATLAAVAKSAYFYSPLNAPLSSVKRRNVILKSMLSLGSIKNEEYLSFKERSLDLADIIPGNPIRLYIQEWIRLWCEEKWGKDALYKKGLKIQTTIDLVNQKSAEESFKPVIKKLREDQGDSLNGALVAMESNSGKIRSLIGGLDFNESQFNRAFKAIRQTGSSFKPIIYAAALEKGIPLDSVELDEPIELDTGAKELWKPRNWNRKFLGEMTLVRALSISNNIITIKTFLKVGVDYIIDIAKRFKITRELLPYPSLALGIAEASVNENVAAFNVFANNGCHIEPFLIEYVKDGLDNKIWRHEPNITKVLDSVVNSKMINALSISMKWRRIHWPESYCTDVEAIGKSGSTNDSTSNWYVGATPGMTTAVYVGRDDNKGMGRQVYSSQTSYPIWLNFHKSLKHKSNRFYLDPSLKEKTINWFDGSEADYVDWREVVTILE